MSRYFVIGLLLSTTTFVPIVFAQSPEATEVVPDPPATMFAYLETGMRVRVQTVQGTASFSLDVYTEDDFATALATTKLENMTGAAEAAKENPAIQRELDAYRRRNGLAESSADRIRMLVPPLTSFGRIEAIGDDYLLIRSEGEGEADAEPRRRRIIPKRSIASIELDARPVRFLEFRSRVPPGERE